MNHRPGPSRRNLLIGAGVLAVAGAGVSYSEVEHMGSMTDYNASVAETRRVLAAQPDLRDFIRYATLAPNGHNIQPWRFEAGAQAITIRPDLARRTPVVDPDDHHVFVGLGAAAENLCLACAARGRPAEMTFNPAGEGAIEVAFGAARAPEPTLFNAIPIRQSTRSDYDGQTVSVGDLRLLAQAAETPGVDLVLITNRTQMNRARDLVMTGNSAQLSDPAFVRELKSWIRFNPRSAMSRGDGLFSVASGNPSLPDWLGPSLIGMALKPKSDNEKYARQMATSAGLAVFVSARANKDHWVRAGRASQRFALQATALGVKLAYVNQPVEVESLRSDLAALAGLSGRRPDILMRFGYASTLPYSARRPVDAVLA